MCVFIWVCRWTSGRVGVFTPVLNDLKLGTVVVVEISGAKGQGSVLHAITAAAQQ